MLTIQRLAGPHQTARLSALKKNAAWRWDKSETFSHYSYPPQHFTTIFLIISDIIGFSAVRASGFSRVGESRIFFENTVRDHEIRKLSMVKHFTAWISSESSYFQKLNGRWRTLVTVGTGRCPSSSATRPASTSSPSPSRRMPTRATTTSMSRFTRSTATQRIAESVIFFSETKIWCTTCSLYAFGRWLMHVFKIDDYKNLISTQAQKTGKNISFQYLPPGCRSSKTVTRSCQSEALLIRGEGSKMKNGLRGETFYILLRSSQPWWRCPWWWWWSNSFSATRTVGTQRVAA